MNFSIPPFNILSFSIVLTAPVNDLLRVHNNNNNNNK